MHEHEYQCAGCGLWGPIDDFVNVESELIHEDFDCLRALLVKMIADNSALHLENARMKAEKQPQKGGYLAPNSNPAA